MTTGYALSLRPILCPSMCICINSLFKLRIVFMHSSPVPCMFQPNRGTAVELVGVGFTDGQGTGSCEVWGLCGEDSSRIFRFKL